MSSYPEVGERSLGEVHGNSPDEVRRAGVTVVAYCLANQLSHDDLLDLLGMVGVTRPASPAKTSPMGKNIPPEVQEQRKAATAARRRAARAAAKQKREAS